MISRIFYFCFAIALSTPSFAQDSISVVTPEKEEPKEKIFQADIGIGLGLYQAYDNISHGTGTGINAAANLASVKLSYSINQFALGLEVKSQKYITDEDTNSIISRASGSSILLHTDYHYVYKRRFNAWLGAGLGVCSFRYTRSFIDSLTRITGTVEAAGPSVSLNTGFRWYFVKFMGIHLSASYSLYPMRYNSFTVNGQARAYISYRRVDESIINIRGLEAKVGLSFRF